MCKLKSAIILKDRVFVPDYDSHDKMLKELGIKDTRENAERLFVRAELSPKTDGIEGVFTDVNSWVFKVDQDVVPEWYVREVDEQRMREAVKEWAKKHIFVGIDGLNISSGAGYYIKDCTKVVIGGSAAVKTIGGYATVKRICESATVNNIYGSATVKRICESATVNNIYGFATVKNIYDSATVNYISGSATVENISGSATVESIYGSATVKNIYNFAIVNYISGSAKVENISGSATVKNICGLATVKNISNFATVKNISNFATVKRICESATVENISGSATVERIFGYATVTCQQKIVCQIQDQAVLICREEHKIYVSETGDWMLTKKTGKSKNKQRGQI